MKILEWWWGWRDRRRRARIEAGAFAAGRFVLDLWMHGRRTPVRFCPTEEEARAFLRGYVVPWIMGWPGTITLNGPWQSPGSPPPARGPYLEVLRVYDIRAVEILTGDEGYRGRLDDLLAAMIREARAEAEADRMAQQAATYAQHLAITKDAYKSMMKGEDPKGGEG